MVAGWVKEVNVDDPGGHLPGGRTSFRGSKAGIWRTRPISNRARARLSPLRCRDDDEAKANRNGDARGRSSAVKASAVPGHLHHIPGHVWGAEMNQQVTSTAEASIKLLLGMIAAALLAGAGMAYF